MNSAVLAGLLLFSTAAGQAAQQWEYLTFTQSVNPQNPYVVVTENRRQTAYTFFEFDVLVAQRLGISGSMPDVSDNDVLNYFGNFGWELAGALQYEIDPKTNDRGYVKRLYFKRPVR